MLILLLGIEKALDKYCERTMFQSSGIYLIFYNFTNLSVYSFCFQNLFPSYLIMLNYINYKQVST